MVFKKTILAPTMSVLKVRYKQEFGIVVSAKARALKGET